MTGERCVNCGQKETAHIRGKCPPLGMHVDITVDTFTRCNRTGHPRLLASLLADETRDVLREVTIDRIAIVPVRL